MKAGHICRPCQNELGGEIKVVGSLIWEEMPCERCGETIPLGPNGLTTGHPAWAVTNWKKNDSLPST